MDVEEVIDAFEGAWRRGPPPGLDQFLAEPGGDAADPLARRKLVAELVMIDLWHRWCRTAAKDPLRVVAATAEPEGDSRFPGREGSEACGDAIPERPLLEDYVRRYPEMGSLEQLDVKLIVEEYRARQRWGDRPEHTEYAARFAGQWTRLRPALQDVDQSQSTSAREPFSTNVGVPVGPACRDPQPVPDRIGKYHVIERLGVGGQAEVYRAVHPGLAREVVVKLSRWAQDSPAAVRDRLLAEGRILAELEHPHLARIYDLDVYEGRPYLVMEYLRGRNLQQRVGEQPLSHREAAELVAKLARAAAVAHARGVIHQDIKPANVILDESGEPRLIDFGLARLHPAWLEQEPEPEYISGTVQYMPPEQARGESQSIGPQSDVFALGAMLFFLLTGGAPFAAASPMESLERARRCDFDAAILGRAGVPRELESVCLHAMQAVPADRFSGAEQFAVSLERFTSRPRRRRRTGVVCACLAVAALAAAGAWLSGSGDSPPSRRQGHGPGAGLAAEILGRPLRRDFGLKFEVLGQAANAEEVVLAEGQDAVFRMEADRDCYAGVWLVDEHDRVTQLFPNRHDEDHFLAGGRPRTVPATADYAIRVTPAAGREYLHVVASTDRWASPQDQTQQGPYVVFATRDEFTQWSQRLRGMAIEKRNSPAVAEHVVVLRVGRSPRP